MKSLMETLMVRENPRNCCRRTKRQLSAFVNPRTDRTPAQGVHGGDHERFMTQEPMSPGGSFCRTGKAMRTDRTPGQGVHGSHHEPLMTALHPLMSKTALMSERARRYLTQRW